MTFIPNSINPAVYKEGNIILAKMRDAMNKSSEIGLTHAFHGTNPTTGQEFRNEYRFTDMDILLDYEDTDIMDSDTEEVLAKPRLIMASEGNNGDRVSEGNLLVEWMVIVNAASNGRLNLEGYCQLCQYMCSEEVWWHWHPYGLLPRLCVVTKVRDGGILDPDLRSRLLIRSLMTHFSIVGEMHNGPR